MVVIVIMSIISTIAIPSYQASIKKGYRTEAMAALTELSQAMERFHAETFTYLGAANMSANTGPPSSTLYPTTSIPRAGDVVAYRITIHAATYNTYTLRATPENAQLKDPCGTLSINHIGIRTAAISNGCW